MTICIGAICDGSKVVVVAADKMITAGYPPIEFEHDTPKIEELSKTCVALTSGSALAHTELFRNVKSELTLMSQPHISLITEKIKDSFVTLRKKAVEEKILKPRGISLNDLYLNYAKILPPEILMKIDREITTSKYELTILIVGVDKEGAHVYEVRDPGVSECYDALGYSSIGIGALHAFSAFMLSDYNPTCSLNSAVYAVYEAKKFSEVSQGVGAQTDMCIITTEGITRLKKEDFEKLGAIYKEKFKPVSTGIKKQIEDLTFGGDGGGTR